MKVESHFPLTYLKKSSPGFTEESICAVSTPNVPKTAFAAAEGGASFSEAHPDRRTNNKTIVGRNRCIKAPQNRLGSKEKFTRDHLPGTPFTRDPIYQGPHLPGTPFTRDPIYQGPHLPGTPFTR